MAKGGKNTPVKTNPSPPMKPPSTATKPGPTKPGGSWSKPGK